MYDFSTFLQFVISGVSVGCIYGLVGIGYSVIYNASGVINFAQGAFVMLGGMVTYVLYALFGWPLFLAALATIALVAGLGFAMEATVIRRLRRLEASVFALILATLACQVVLESAALQVFGDEPHSFPSFTVADPIKVLGAAFSLQSVWIVGVSLALIYALGLLYRKTLVGKAMRACAVSPDVARILGINVERMIAYAFALSGALGAIGGILITPTQYTAFFVAVPFAVNGFIAAIIGGFGNPLGAFVGGVVLGVLQTVGVIFIDSGYKNVVAFTLLLLLLFFRPQGLFGSYVEEH
jgi:branched-chain amino acid transport system permease protein